MKAYRFSGIFKFFILLQLSLFIIDGSSGQERWFQIELSIFSNENVEDRQAEYWTPENTDLSYPATSRRLRQLTDLFLSGKNLDEQSNIEKPLSQEDVTNLIRIDQLKNIKPEARIADSEFKLIDFARDDFVQLPPNESDFQQTNRALERSSEHRLLFHGLWRQAVRKSSDAIPIYVEGGLNYGEDYELQGSLTIRFNETEDRIVVDTDVWLVEYSIVNNASEDWILPKTPESIQTEESALPSSLSYYPNKVYPMKQTRQMRSNEFHYLDHPALGLVISVKPYNAPSNLESESRF